MDWSVVHGVTNLQFGNLPKGGLSTCGSILDWYYPTNGNAERKVLDPGQADNGKAGKLGFIMQIFSEPWDNRRNRKAAANRHVTTLSSLVSADRLLTEAPAHQCVTNTCSLNCYTATLLRTALAVLIQHSGMIAEGVRIKKFWEKASVEEIQILLFDVYKISSHCNPFP